ncbi:MAG: DUF3073 domain-containing protein [Mycobacteriaceae bacterium]|jgi:Protein of unknown function (DUF3073)
MGRGRAKAKQTKVARELKYSSPNTDFDTLQRELANGGSDPFTVKPRRSEVLHSDEVRPSWEDDDVDERKR